MSNSERNPFKKLSTFIKKDEQKFVDSNFNHSLGPFSFLFQMRKWWWRIFISTIVGILFGLTTMFFVQNTGLYGSGLAGIFQGIARISNVGIVNSGVSQELAKLYYDLLFYGLYFLVNIPLVIFGYYKIGKNFAILSFNVLLVENIVPILLGFIPGIEDVLIFGRANSAHITESAIEAGINILTFTEGDLKGFASILTYSIISGIINGFTYALILVVGGSTGGVDFISFYYSIRKGKSISLIITYLNIASIVLSTIIGTFIPVSMSSSYLDGINPWSYELFFTQNLILSIVATIISGICLNYLFPKNKIVKVSIYSEKILDIRNKLYEDNFHHALTINKTIGGYTMQEKQNAEIICLYIELPKLLQQIQEIDNECFITITHIMGIKGKFTIEDSIN